MRETSELAEHCPLAPLAGRPARPAALVAKGSFRLSDSITFVGPATSRKLRSLWLDANDGAHSDSFAKKSSGTYTYQVCEAGTTTCSADSTVSF